MPSAMIGRKQEATRYERDAEVVTVVVVVVVWTFHRRFHRVAKRVVPGFPFFAIARSLRSPCELRSGVDCSSHDGESANERPASAVT
jgi:hypothetical protein